MERNLEFIKEESKKLFDNKIENMCDSEITDELSEFLKDKQEIVCKNVCELLKNNECVYEHGMFYLKAQDGFTEDLIADWENINSISSPEEREAEIQSTILYNFDALWMTAIHRAFPYKTTNTQCGWGKMDLIKR